jgi:hypothetical protein
MKPTYLPLNNMSYSTDIPLICSAFLTQGSVELFISTFDEFSLFEVSYVCDADCYYLGKDDMLGVHFDDDTFGMSFLISTCNQALFLNRFTCPYLFKPNPEEQTVFVSHFITLANTRYFNRGEYTAEGAVAVVNELIRDARAEYIISGGESNPGPVFNVTELPTYDILWLKFRRLLGWTADQASDLLRRGMELICHTMAQVKQLNPVNLLKTFFDGAKDLATDFLRTAGQACAFTADLISLVVSFFDMTSAILSPFIVIDGNGLAARHSPNVVLRITIFVSTFIRVMKIFAPFLGLPLTAEPQSGESGYSNLFFSSFIMSILPKSIREFVIDGSKLTNHKLVDDTTFMFDFFQVALDVPRAVLVFFLPKQLGDKVEDAFEHLSLIIPLSKHGKMLAEVNDLNVEFAKSAKVAHDVAFQQRVDAVKDRFFEYVARVGLLRRDLPQYIVNANDKFKRICNKLTYIRTTTRVEPVWAVFEGPAGVGKSHFMARLQNAFKKTYRIYAHSTGSEGKDWYDAYDDEDIMVVDDVGQKGVKQWSNFINMVSSIKFPLECARAELKDTKSFQSRLIMCTTNSVEITLTADSGITHKEALYRRMQRFDFKNVVLDRDINSPFYNTSTGHIILKNHVFHQGTWKWIDVRTIYLAPAEQDLQAAQTLEQRRAVNELALQTVGNYLVDCMKRKKREYEGSILADDPLEFEAIPQSNIIQKAFMFTKEYVAFICDGISYWASQTLEIIRTDTHKALLGALLGGTVAAIFLTQLSSCLGSKSNDDPVDQALSSVPVYTSGRHKKLTLSTAVPNSLQKIFDMQIDDVDVPQLSRFKKNMFAAEFHYVNPDGVEVSSCSHILMSGRYMVTTYHTALFDEKYGVYVSVFSSKDNCVYDKIRVTRVMADEHDDIAVFSLPPGLPNYTRHLHLAADAAGTTDFFMVFPNKLRSLSGRLTKPDLCLQYKNYNYTNVITNELTGLHKGLFHDISGASMCGMPVVTTNGFLVGHHVAELHHPDGTVKGVVKLFRPPVRNKLKELFSETEEHYVPISRESLNANAAKVELTGVVSMPSLDTQFVPSLVDGIFPKERVPAELGVKPLKTMKTISRKTFETTEMPSIKVFPLLRAYTDTLIEDWKPTIWDTTEVIHGDGIMSRIDPNTSCGFGLVGGKRDHIDYDNDLFSEHLKSKIDDIVNSCKTGDATDYPNMLFSEQFKDELRDVEKRDKPRVFRMAPLAHTVLTRKFFGSLLSSFHTRRSRRKTGIMLGINPFSDEWSEMAYNVVKNGDNCFDGDFSKFDKKMLSTFQQILVDTIMTKLKESQVTEELYKGVKVEHIAQFLLHSIMMNPFVCVDEVWLSTHGLPSGCGLTAWFNSMIHKLYMFYCFCILYYKKFGCLPTIETYREHVVNCVYGDDGLTGVSYEYCDWFNGPTVRDIMKDLGLDYTPGDKGDWDYTTRSIYECTFLKRSFRMHLDLGTIVAPVSKKSMMSTLNFVKDPMDNESLTEIKLLNFQREAFLHEDYDVLMKYVRNFVEEKGLYPLWLSKQALIQMYRTDGFINHLVWN